MNWRKVLEPIIKQAGSIVVSQFGKKLEIHEKKDQSFVTQADLASEQYLITELQKVFPEASIWSEEAGKNGNAEYNWVIDPLDGTTNFMRRIPYFCISVALTYQNKPVCGAVYQPITNEFFWAEQNHGAWCNDKRIHASTRTHLSQAIIAFGLSYDPVVRTRFLMQTEELDKRVYAIRHMGAIALDLAYCANGQFDGVIFTDLKWWDVAAGLILIEQAGGKITDFRAQELAPDYTSCVVGGASLYPQLQNMVAQFKE